LTDENGFGIPGSIPVGGETDANGFGGLPIAPSTTANPSFAALPSFAGFGATDQNGFGFGTVGPASGTTATKDTGSFSTGLFGLSDGNAISPPSPSKGFAIDANPPPFAGAFGTSLTTTVTTNTTFSFGSTATATTPTSAQTVTEPSEKEIEDEKAPRFVSIHEIMQSSTPSESSAFGAPKEENKDYHFGSLEKVATFEYKPPDGEAPVVYTFGTAVVGLNKEYCCILLFAFFISEFFDSQI
jgi:hypothetical protein